MARQTVSTIVPDKQVMVKAIKQGLSQDRKFRGDEIAHNAPLMMAAHSYLAVHFQRVQKGETPNDFLLSVSSWYNRGNNLTVNQLAGILNVMMGDYKRKQAQNQEGQKTQKPESYTPNIPNGYYMVAGTEFLVEDVDFGDFPSGTQKVSTLAYSQKYGKKMMVGFAFLRGDTYQIWGSQKDKLGAKHEGQVKELITSKDHGESAGMAFALASSRCRRCRKLLKVDASLCEGFGPDCSEILGRGIQYKETKSRVGRKRKAVNQRERIA